MAKDKKKKRFTIRKAQVDKMPKLRDELDDNDRDQVEPYPEPPVHLQDEDWARPGDEDKPPGELKQVSAMRKEQ